MIDRAAKVIIKAVQREAFKEEFEVIAQSSSENDSSRNEAKARKKSLKKSTLYQLDPYVDDAGILRVGGRLRQTNLSFNEKHPVLLPKGHHVSMLILRYSPSRYITRDARLPMEPCPACRKVVFSDTRRA